MNNIVMHSQDTQETIDEMIEQQEADLFLEIPVSIGRNFIGYSFNSLEDAEVSTFDHPMFDHIRVEEIAEIIMGDSLPIYISGRFLQPFINALSYETTVKLWKFLYLQVFSEQKLDPSEDVNLQYDLRDLLTLSQYLKP